MCLHMTVSAATLACWRTRACRHSPTGPAHVADACHFGSATAPAVCGKSPLPQVDPFPFSSIVVLAVPAVISPPFFHSHPHAVYDRLYWRQNQAHPCLLAATDSPPRWSLRCSPWMTSTSSVSPPARQRTARFLVSCFRSVFFLFFPRSSCSNSIYLGVCPHRLEERPLPMPERPPRPSCF